MATPLATDLQCINVLRGLSIDMVQAANSGHPGMPLGAMPIAYAIWKRHLKHNPANPNWIDRDRFILSAGHGSAMLYALLHATGYNLSMDELKNFRQWGSKTPGHPENHLTPGVEMATGPLGQGVATSVGLAIAERFLAAKYNRPGFELINHRTFVICSDGDLMEGISQEAASLAGHLGLGKLVWLYDDNQITIDGGTNLSFSDDTAAKFSALNWNVIHVDDGMNVDAVDRAISEAGNQSDRPTLIICKTVIGFGSPNKAGSSKVHGSPLGADELRLTKESLGLPTDVPFYFPDDLATEMNAKQPGASAESLWKEKFLQYSAQYPREAKEFLGETGTDWISNLPTFTEPLATRNATGAFLNSIKDVFPNLLSGSADLSDNVFTTLKDAGAQSRQTPEGRNIFYGVREHAMAAAANGISLHGGCKAVCGTFLIFSDYCKPSIRLAALMGCPTLFTFSHDSIGLGEDGPTHQPIEQLAMLRAIPGLSVYRPADANETVACWASAIQSVKPSVIVTSRQALPIVTSSDYKNHPSAHGGYVLRAESIDLKLILVATGSEVQLALSAASELEAEGIGTRVVNLVCWSVFDAQADEYRQKVLPKNVPTLAVEAQCEVGWHKYADEVLCMRSFGASAPAPTLFEKFGFTVENVVATAKRLLLSP